MKPALVLLLLGASACTPVGTTTREAPVARLSKGVPASVGSLPLRNALQFEETGLWLEQPKIIGGREALPGENPWQVALVAGQITDKNVVFCGGSLIGPTWVLTAAHCVDSGTVPSQVDVVSGSNDLDNGGKRTRVAHITVYPAWDSAHQNNDLALLELSEAAPGIPVSLIVPANEQQLSVPGSLVRVTGWGATAQNGNTVRKLRTVEVPLVSRSDCNDRVSYNGEITESMICAGWQRGGADSCQGDSGGPLTAPLGTGRILIGLVSWGAGCAQPNKYGVYTRLALFSGWVKACVSGGHCKLD